MKQTKAENLRAKTQRAALSPHLLCALSVYIRAQFGYFVFSLNTCWVQHRVVLQADSPLFTTHNTVTEACTLQALYGLKVCRHKLRAEI